MCGIAGILLKRDGTGIHAAPALVDMLDGCQHRGPDSTGFALYGPARPGRLKLRFHVGTGHRAAAAVARLREVFESFGAAILEEAMDGATWRVLCSFSGDLQALSYAVERAAATPHAAEEEEPARHSSTPSCRGRKHHPADGKDPAHPQAAEENATVFSIGESLEIVKDVGTAHDVDGAYHVHSFPASHGLGHVRLATESDVKPEASHPFWATGFKDVAIVHNGQITNYWKMRRRLGRRGFQFATDNDSELIAVYLADKLSQGIALKEALQDSIDDLDGTFSFLVSTGEEIGYAKDRLAAKPMIVLENDDLVAIASEEVSLNRLYPGQALSTREPPPGSCATWRLPAAA